jgi:acetolactate synthase-1/2/3 large subunit
MLRIRTAGTALAETLSRFGVEEVFTLHGGHLDAFLVECPKQGIRLTDTRHEAAAGHAADAYARATEGRLGVCAVTAGPGLTNAITAIANAYLDAIPTLFIVGSPPLREEETNTLQGGIDQIALARPVSKWAHRVTRPERIADLADKAMRIATTGRPGPVVLDVPIDVLFSPAQEPFIEPQLAATDVQRPAPSADALSRLAELLRGAERPVLIAGGGVLLSGAADALRRFADASGVPVISGPRALGVMPAGNHPADGGGVNTLVSLGILGTPPDTVVLLGARMGFLLLGPGASMIPRDARIGQVDIEAAEIGRLGPIEVPVVGDCRSALEMLCALDIAWPVRSEWQTAVHKAAALSGQMFANADPGAPGKIHPHHAAAAIAAALPPKTTVVLDGGEAAIWMSSVIHADEPGQVLGQGYLGCLGIGPGFAIGAARARPGRPVVLVTGDGAFGFHAQEFDTMCRHGIPIVTVILNNRCWGMSQHGQDAVYGPERRTVVALGDPAYEQLCTAFGGVGERIERVEDIGPAVQRAIETGRPACVNVLIDDAVVHPATTMLLGDVTTEDEIVIPYYRNLPRHS